MYKKTENRIQVWTITPHYEEAPEPPSKKGGKRAIVRGIFCLTYYDSLYL